MARFEYQLITRQANQDLQQTLNEYGQGRWHVVGIQKGGLVEILLEREIVEDKQPAPAVEDGWYKVIESQIIYILHDNMKQGMVMSATKIIDSIMTLICNLTNRPIPCDEELKVIHMGKRSCPVFDKDLKDDNSIPPTELAIRKELDIYTESLHVTGNNTMRSRCSKAIMDIIWKVIEWREKK